MQVSLTNSSGLERRLEVSVPSDRLAQDVDQRLKQLARTARIKGFRAGKVPMAVVRKQFGGQVQQDAVNDLVQSTFAEAVSQQRLRPVGGPRIEPLAMDPAAEQIRYAAVFEVMPEFELKPLADLQVEKPAAEVTDADVDAMLESMRGQRPIFTVVERAAAEGDRATIDYEGRIDGEIFPGGQGELQVVLGAHRILPEIETALAGMSAGDSRRGIEARFPDDYGAATVAGKTALFDVTVKSVEEKSLPALDEGFARDFGVEHGGIEELRAEVRRSMQRELDEAVRARLREQLFDGLLRENQIDLPRGMVEQQIREMQVDALRRSGSRDPAAAPAREGLEPTARRRVTLGLIVGEVIRANSLRVNRERVEQRLDQAVAAYPDPEEARRSLLASRDAMSQLESAALEDQAVDWLLTQVKVVEQPSTFSAVTGFANKV